MTSVFKSFNRDNTGKIAETKEEKVSTEMILAFVKYAYDMFTVIREGLTEHGILIKETMTDEEREHLSREYNIDKTLDKTVTDLW